HCYRYLRALHSFPTRRSSDLMELGIAEGLLGRPEADQRAALVGSLALLQRRHRLAQRVFLVVVEAVAPDVERELARECIDHRHRSEEHSLNSSHVKISYAVFC